MQYHPDLIDYDGLRRDQARKTAEFHKVFRKVARTDSGKVVFFQHVYERYKYLDVTSERHALNPVYEYARGPYSTMTKKEYFIHLLQNGKT